MPYVNNQGVRIYYEVEGEGPPLMLAHPSGSSTEDWHQYGYTEKLNEDYKLILFDARGHGRSDKPHDAESYKYDLMAGDALAVLNDLGIEKALYWGYSMGSSIGFRLATRSQRRFHSFIFGGISPYRGEEEVKMLKEINNNLKISVADPDAYLAIREALLGRALTAVEKSQILAKTQERCWRGRPRV